MKEWQLLIKSKTCLMN